MGGESSQQQTTQSKTQPWKPTIGPLNQIIGQIGGQIGNTTPTAAENSAINTIAANAQQGNPYLPQIQSLATDLLGGGPDRTGMVNDAYANYQKQAQPFLDPSYLDPSTNPAFMKYMDTIQSDVANRVNGMFAGAGRDMSGMNQQTLARGIAEGTAPVFANQYNQNVATQRGMMEGLLGGAQGSAGLLSNLDQASFGNRAQGVGAAAEALGAQNYGANATLQAEALRRGLPLGNIGQVSSLLLPIAGLGSQSTAVSNATQQMAPVQEAMGWMNVAKGIQPGLQSIGGGAQYLGGIFGGLR